MDEDLKPWAYTASKVLSYLNFLNQLRTSSHDIVPFEVKERITRALKTHCHDLGVPSSDAGMRVDVKEHPSRPGSSDAKTLMASTLLATYADAYVV